MNANELADAMEIRASIRRKATSRKSVQENANDRLADQLDEAATMLRQQQAKIAEQERTIKCKRIHIRKLEMVTYWLVENRPEVWEDIRKWAENERK